MVMMMLEFSRTKRLAKMGIRVIRFANEDVLKSPDVVAEQIWRELTGSSLD